MGHRRRRAETGVTIMKMDAGLDTGPMLAVAPHADLARRMIRQVLHDRLAQFGAELLVETIPGYVAGNDHAAAAARDRHELCRENQEGGRAH